MVVLDVTTDAGDARRLVTSTFPADARAGDEVAAIGVAIDLTESEGWRVMAAPRIQWSPRSTSKIGWQLLSDAGFDVALLADVKPRSRQPLLADDGDAFYSLMAASRTIGNQSEVPPAEPLESVELLRRPEELTGQWLSLRWRLCRSREFPSPNPTDKTKLGQDHYYQIDAVVDLGKVVVKIERSDPDSGPPAIFENRYPVSVVTAEIPEFLRQRILAQEGGDAVVSQHRSLIGIQGFIIACGVTNRSS